jgi:hypothetical protein
MVMVNSMTPIQVLGPEGLLWCESFQSVRSSLRAAPHSWVDVAQQPSHFVLRWYLRCPMLLKLPYDHVHLPKSLIQGDPTVDLMALVTVRSFILTRGSWSLSSCMAFCCDLRSAV